jgi:hypothetical protein
VESAFFDQLIGFFLHFQIWDVVKVFLLFLLFLYLIFAGVVIKQVKLMKEALNGILDWPLTIVAWIHLSIAIVVFLLALAIL